MTQAKARFASFEEYLSYSNNTTTEGFYELIEGELVQLPPESDLNLRIVSQLFARLLQAGIPAHLIRPGKCEIQVPVLQSKDSANRYPDLVILLEEHLPLLEKRATITLDMPPPLLAVEVVSPGKANRNRDYISKRAQYAAIGVPEYWLIDPQSRTVTVLELQGNEYREVGVFSGSDRIFSPTFPGLGLTVDRLFPAGYFWITTDEMR